MKTSQRIAELYTDVPPEAFQQLVEFRERYPYQTAALNSRTWRFIDTIDGDSTVLLPAGGTTIAEVSFRTLEHLAQHHRVIAPDYPAIKSMADLCSGLVGLLDHLGIGAFYAMGGSYGGWVLQSLVRQVPERIERLVVTTVGPPNPRNSRQLARILRVMRIMPTAMVKSLISRSFSRLVDSDSADPDQQLLWALAQEAVLYRSKKADIITALQRLVDQTANDLAPDDLSDWTGQILMVFGAQDPATSPDKIQAMRDLYPRGLVKVFEDGGHDISITHRREYLDTIDEFLMAIPT